VGLLCVLVVSGANSAHAQTTEGQGWNVSIDFLGLSTRGNDVHVGDVYTERQSVSGTIGNFRLDYGVTYEPIITKMDSDPSWMVTGGYRGAQWGAGARYWRTVSEGSADGEANTAPETPTSAFITGIRMWENSIIPVTNVQDPSGLSPVTFHSENRLEHFRIDAYAERRWITGRSLNLTTRFGVAHSRTENTRSEGQTQRAFCFTFSGLCVVPPAVTNSTLTNDIAIDSESDATMSLTGPMIAVVGDTTFGRVRLDWLIGNSVMMGTAETTGEWTDVDMINEVTVASGVPTETSTVLDGSIPIDFEERTVVPVIELEVKASVRVVGRLFVGAGVFSSSWFGVPVAPAFVVPDDWTDVQGTGWRHQNRNISFTGFSIFAGVGF
jgi:hypothetical protein